MLKIIQFPEMIELFSCKGKVALPFVDVMMHKLNKKFDINK